MEGIIPLSCTQVKSKTLVKKIMFNLAASTGLSRFQTHTRKYFLLSKVESNLWPSDRHFWNPHRAFLVISGSGFSCQEDVWVGFTSGRAALQDHWGRDHLVLRRDWVQDCPRAHALQPGPATFRSCLRRVRVGGWRQVGHGPRRKVHRRLQKIRQDRSVGCRLK